jgi:hypothetical protein
MRDIAFTILGQAYSKANSRKIVTIGGRPASIKGKDALTFEANALKQIPPLFRLQLSGPVAVTLRMFYANERPDLDESLVLDILQDRYASFKSGDTKIRKLVQKGVYVNDRQVREKHVYHEIDRANPRVEIFIEPLEAQQAAIALPLPARAFDPLDL